MGNLLELLVVLMLLVWIFYRYLLPPMRPDYGLSPGTKLLDMSRYGGMDAAFAGLAPLIGAFAVTALMGSDARVGGTLGIVYGVGCAVAVDGTARTVRDVLLSVVGALAAVVSVVSALSDPICGGASSDRLPAMLILATLAFVFGGIMGVRYFELNARVGLSAFVVVELILYATTAMSVVDDHLALVVFGATVGLGFLSAVAPEITFGLGGLLLFGVTFYTGVFLTADNCGGLGPGQSLFLLGAAVAYVVVAFFRRRFSRKD
ncbi:MAG: hypothetical protein QM621_00240 [Aeromicrobium sp.]|uniref:hypothetical protein n=1 Tax=Aeromicrobium sp. TaxID=1871063 RepID=UPI0039E3D90F